MAEYLKILYHAWCKDHPVSTRSTQLNDFVKYASSALYRTEDEIKNFCIKYEWFK